jgi:hypothetical protein
MILLKRKFSRLRPSWSAALVVLTAGWASGPGGVAAETASVQPALDYVDDEISVRLVLRSPDQLTAFYLGRDFNRAAIDQILDTCFITPIIHNKTLDVLWLALDEWRFSRGDTRIERIKRDYWPKRWRAAGLPRPQQSTFGWTLMPEVRDLRLDEGVGGSVVIPVQTQPFRLTMTFPTGADRRGPVKTVVFEDLICAPHPS